MNLSQLEQEVFDQMNYFPNLSTYKQFVRRNLNSQYQELCMERNWLFVERTVTFNVKKKVVGNVTGDVHIIVDDVTALNPRKVLAVNFPLLPEMEGQILRDTDTKLEYTIIRVEGTSFFIDNNWNGIKNGSTHIYNWEIEFVRYAMPVDCIEPLNFSSETDDWGKLGFLSRSRADSLYLDRDNEGDPIAVIDDEFRVDAAPIKPLVVTTGSGPGLPTGFNHNQKYEYCYTIYREGRESPPSKSVLLKTPKTGNFAINVSNLDDTGFWRDATGAAKKDSGMQKMIYRRDVTNEGRWTLIGTVDSITTTFPDTTFEPYATFSYKTDPIFRITNTTDIITLPNGAPYQNMQFWFVPDEDKPITLRYHYTPPDLKGDTDTPVFHRAYHLLLKYLVLIDMFAQANNDQQLVRWSQRADQLKVKMEGTYLQRDGQDIRRGRSDQYNGSRMSAFSGTPVRTS